MTKKRQKRNVNVAGYTFGKWIREVDAILLGECGLTHRDLPFSPSYAGWYSGMSPKEYAMFLLYVAGYPQE